MAEVAAVDLSVLIVTYNSRAFIGECVDAVRASMTRHTYEIIAVDNASSDETSKYLRDEYPSVLVIDMGRNAGFSAGNNCAYRASRGRHVVLLNGDATVTPGALDALIEFLDSSEGAGVVAPRLLNPDGSDQGTARSFPTPAAAVFGRRSPLTRMFPANHYSRRYMSGLDREGSEPFEVDWVSGACLMVPRAVVKTVGLLDESFFMHWEDADWCRRIKQRGFTVSCLPTAQVFHAEGSSRRGWPSAQVRYFHRGAYRYYAKHHLTGARSVLRPVAAGALAGRAALVMARNRSTAISSR